MGTDNGSDVLTAVQVGPDTTEAAVGAAVADVPAAVPGDAPDAIEEAVPEIESEKSLRRWRRRGRRSGEGRPVERRGSPPPAGGGAVYGLGMIGALVYFIATAKTRRDYGLAFLKAMVWPALLVYRLFRYLGE